MNDQNYQPTKRKASFIAKIFIILGIIFFVLILAFVGLIIVKPYGIDPIKVVPALLETEPQSSYDHPALSTKQEAILEAAGIDPSQIPTEISESQQKCAINIVGEKRAKEIAEGAIPSLPEILKLKICLNK